MNAEETLKAINKKLHEVIIDQESKNPVDEGKGKPYFRGFQAGQVRTCRHVIEMIDELYKPKVVLSKNNLPDTEAKRL